jgi:microcompartment protein CcmL/EutN
MKRDSALGFIETVGLASSIAAADAALKAANVKLIGRELSKGQGWVTIKITGDVAAVGAAIEAAKAVTAVASMTTVIPRPAAGLGDVMVRNKETTLKQDNQDYQDKQDKVEEQASSEEPAAIETAGFEKAENVEEVLKQESSPQENAGRQNRNGKRKK